MAINPIAFGRTVNEQFLRYQLTAFPIADEALARQAEESIRGAGARPTPLIKGPYLSLAKAFRMGPSVQDLIAQGVLHPALSGIVEYPDLFAHQAETLSRVRQGFHCLVSTGTGSGKTEAFLVPILDHCLRLRDEGAPEGVVAILIYPMNALAVDQLGRLRRMLAGTGVSFGMYVGSTAADEGEIGSDVVRMKPGEGKVEYARYVERHRAHERVVISPPEERLTEKEMAAHPPRLLLTNYNQLEILLTRGKDLGMFVRAPLRFLVCDEAHTYTGAVGAEVACLVRRLRAFCGKGPDEVLCIGTSATIVDPIEGEEAGRAFAHRFFGVAPDRIALVQEQYLAEEWPAQRYLSPVPQGDGEALLERALAAIAEGGSPAEIAGVVQELTGQTIRLGTEWSADLHAFLKQSEYVKTLAEVLERPRRLDEATVEVAKRLGRPVADPVMGRGELLATLALGAAAERGENPLLRPKVHYFVRGLEGAVATFVENAGRVEPRLSLAIEAARAEYPERAAAAFFPVLSCKTCGQHYFTTWLRNFAVEAGEAVGGDAEGDAVIWEAVPEDEGERVVFTDRFLSEESDDPDEARIAAEKLETKRVSLFLCRHCGTVHGKAAEACAGPRCRRADRMVPISILSRSAGGKVLTCPSCAQKGRKIGERIIEPLKPLRAVTVADVHILAQDMVNAVAEREQKLLVFTDNRQDAAFQAGWMQDHARRYRLRHLIHDFLQERGAPTALGDIQAHLLALFKGDPDLAQALCPEVFAGQVQEAFGKSLQEALQYYIRIALMREWGTSFKQRDSLETWGVARMAYAGITPEDPMIRTWAERYHLPVEAVADGIAALLDVWRRGRYLYDPQAPIFSKYWHDSAEEVQRGYLPFLDFPPKGLKLERAPSDRETWVTQVLAPRGQTLAQGFVAKWGLAPAQSNTFLEELWQRLTEVWKVLVPVTLMGQKGNPLPGCVGLFQVGTQASGLLVQFERYRCGICHRAHARMTPQGVCTTHHCGGTLRREEPPASDYNVATLRRPFSMLRAQEHSAQVPARVREVIERDFKAVPGKVNCLVATPTLELGVDIGALDMVLLRNVPPRPANYWQRVGRAGRRHRMAVLYTYCRRSQHDGYFFEDPARLLDARIDSPRFNLRNPVMLRKHVHAAVLSELIRLTRPEAGAGLGGAEIQEIQGTLAEVIPAYVESYLFTPDRHFRVDPFGVGRLARVIARYRDRLVPAVERVFATHWPSDAAAEAAPDRLAGVVDGMADRLQEAVTRLHQRMGWAVAQRATLSQEKAQRMLDEYEERLLRRCDEYLKGLAKAERANYSLTVLAVEGFLPGYGTYEGGIRGFAGRTLAAGAKSFEFDLSRPPSIGVREYVPGNLIYANGGRFKVTMFHLPVGEKGVQPDLYVVDVQKEILREKGAQGAGYGGGEEQELAAIPICDVDLGYTSRISDEEENRFQLPVFLLGYRKAAHRGGDAYRIGTRDLLHLRGQEVRLVNVGPADRVRQGRLGYPLCVVCGATRSPYASDAEIARFTDVHRERCGREPGWLGVSADTQVDTLLVQGLASRADAVNLGEAIRQGASRVLEMDPEDLHILVLPTSEEHWDLLLYDPMPGGSGLLSQILERWPEVRQAALETVTECKGQCERSCYECLRAYQNTAYHGILDRHLAKRLLEELPEVHWEREIPPLVASATVGAGSPTNPGEAELAALLQRAGFPAPLQQHRIPIGHPAPTTTPDFAYLDPGADLKVAIYLDGLSMGIHGNDKQAQRDAMIRSVLEADGWQVLVIARSELTDQQAMLLHFKRLAHALKQKDRAKVLAEDPSWFAPVRETVHAVKAAVREAVREAIRLVSHEVARPFETHLPVYSLRAAAGKFGEGQEVEEEGWVEVSGMKLREGMFVAQVVGKSMEPRIPDGSYCVFRAPVQGSRQGKIVLVQHHGLHDPETGGRYTVKRYDSEKITDEAGGWRHARVTLSPLNPEYEPIVLTPESEEDVQIVAEWLAVLGRA